MSTPTDEAWAEALMATAKESQAHELACAQRNEVTLLIAGYKKRKASLLNKLTRHLSKCSRPWMALDCVSDEEDAEDMEAEDEGGSTDYAAAGPSRGLGGDTGAGPAPVTGRNGSDGKDSAPGKAQRRVSEESLMAQVIWSD